MFGAESVFKALFAFEKKKGAQTAPFFVGVGGPVGVGKSTYAEALKQFLLQRASESDIAIESDQVSVVSTDHFFYSQKTLFNLGVQKGDPDSYQLDSIKSFMRALCAGEEAQHPVYSHELYDIDVSSMQLVSANQRVVIVEGLNVFSTAEIATHLDFGVLLFISPKELRNQQAARLARSFKQTLPDYLLNSMVLDYWYRINRPNAWRHRPKLRWRPNVIILKTPFIQKGIALDNGVVLDKGIVLKLP